MKPRSCARKWQVEAVRDGRIQGKDLHSALRHQATCAECTHEERSLAELANEVARLPPLARDAVTARRSRERLVAALNESVLQAPRSRPVRRKAFALAFGGIALATTGFALSRSVPHASSTNNLGPLVEVHAEPAARWSERIDPRQDVVNLLEGAASFKVHPHQGRRVVIELPDGEIEDLGTVFEIRVSERQTRHISVSEGRVSIHLQGRPDFSLGAGEAWGSEPVAAVTEAPSALAPSEAPRRVSASSLNSQEVAAVAGTPSAALGAGQGAASARPHLVASDKTRAATSSQVPAQAENSAIDTQSAKAEDDSYLRIVDSLERSKYAEARVLAKNYLLRFPNGFRRVEVLNIATGGASEAGDGGTAR